MNLLSGATPSALLVGAVLALVVGAMATVAGLDRDRAFYPAVLMVVASYFVLFAVLGGDRRVLAVELGLAMVFVVLALVGFRRSLWIVAAGLVGHGVFDVFHGQFIANPGLPEWWPSFCMAYDVVAGAYLAVLLSRRPEVVRPAPGPA